MLEYEIVSNTPECVIVRVYSDSRENIDSPVTRRGIISYLKENGYGNFDLVDPFSAVFPVDAEKKPLVTVEGERLTGNLNGFCKEFRVFCR